MALEVKSIHPEAGRIVNTINESAKFLATTLNKDLHVFLRNDSGVFLFYPRTELYFGTLPLSIQSIDITGLGELMMCVDSTQEDPGVVSVALNYVYMAVRHVLEMGFLTQKISESYEEITLLHSLGEILGSVVSLEEAGEKILEEIVGALDVEKADLWVKDETTTSLRLLATVGGDYDRPLIDIDSPDSLIGRVFSTQEHVILSNEDQLPREVTLSGYLQRQACLAVPISYSSTPGESKSVGVIILIGRKNQHRHHAYGSVDLLPFTSGELKLVEAIASLIGVALENGKLLEDNVRHEKLEQELQLAHDLQMKLLPHPQKNVGEWEVEAKCIPAESVGGDFYNLFAFGDGKLGVMLGDVSGHGFGAALVMALTMAAFAIQAKEESSPAQVLGKVHDAICSELNATEMYVTLFYAVLDPASKSLVYSNAGHPHAYVMTAEGAERLGATDLPMGLVDEVVYGEKNMDLQEDDMLLLFTDGILNTIGKGDRESEEVVIKTVMDSFGLPLEEVVKRVLRNDYNPKFSLPSDDRTLVMIKSSISQ